MTVRKATINTQKGNAVLTAYHIALYKLKYTDFCSLYMSLRHWQRNSYTFVKDKFTTQL